MPRIPLEKLPEHHLEKRIPSTILNEEDQRIANEIRRDFAGAEVSLITVLRGAKQFSSNLVNHLGNQIYKKPVILQDRFRAESYGEKAESNGDPKILVPLLNPERSIKHKDVVLIEDIVDKGYTMFLCALPYILRYEPNSLVIASMLTKNSKRDPIASKLPLKYYGQDIDFFAVGRGLDWLEHYRRGKSISEVIVH